MYVSIMERKGIEKGIQLGKAEGIQLGKAEGIQLGKAEGIQLGKYEVARALLADRMPPERVARMTGLSLTEIEGLLHS